MAKNLVVSKPPKFIKDYCSMKCYFLSVYDIDAAYCFGFGKWIEKIKTKPPKRCENCLSWESKNDN